MSFHLFFVSYWLNVLPSQFPKAAVSSWCNRKTIVFHFPRSKAIGEIRQSWYDEVATTATFPLHLEQLLLPLESGKWKL
jgi:hypothetical protein